MSDSARGPAERVLLDAEAHNRAVGHENAGFLSAVRGFVPVIAPLLQLSKRFAPWDDVAAELPELYPNLRLRRRVEQLPLLDASVEALDDREVLRAAALLAVLSHAYWYVDCRAPTRLPDVLRVPWKQVRARLGRKQEVLSYIDLIVYNWRHRSGAPTELALENLELLLPTVGNQEERVFYLTQLEILGRAGPLPQLMAAAQSAAVRGDASSLESHLERIAAVFAHSASALARIEPREQAATYVDAVRWAKTVAPLAVPFGPNQLGPSGTSSPLFNALDIFFGRSRFDSQLGREIRSLRDTYPPAWQRYLQALGGVAVSQFVAQRGGPALRDAWAGALELYAGEAGFLGRHRRKVYGYLEIAFKVGRALTIGGFAGAFADRTWNEVDAALVSAQSERPRSRTVADLPVTPSAAVPRAPRTLHVSDVVTHNQPELGYWVVVDGYVYDVTRFLSAHPGGRSALLAYVGLDASAGFRRAHGASARVDRMRDALRLGPLQRLELDERAAGSGGLQAAYHVTVAALYLLVEMENAYALDQSFRLSTEPQPERTAYEQLRALERHRRFLDEYVSVLETRTLPAVWSATRAALFPAQPADELYLLLKAVRGGATGHGARDAAARAVEQFEAREGSALDAQLDSRDAGDLGLLRDLKRALIVVVRAFEAESLTLHSRSALRVRRECLRCVCILRRYYRHAASSLPKGRGN